MSVPKQFLGQWRSIEFELYFDSYDKYLAFNKNIGKKTYAKCVVLKDDHSIHPPESKYSAIPKEVILTYRSGEEANVFDFCKELKGKARTNASCGTHVHFDMRHVDEKTALLYGSRLDKVVPALRALLPASRRKNKFCAKDINEIGGKQEGAARYAFVNMKAYNKYKTIEVRGHSGTLNAEKILNWVAICEKIMTTDKVLRSKIKTPKTLMKHYEFGARLTDYIQERFDKFKLETGVDAEHEQ